MRAYILAVAVLLAACSDPTAGSPISAPGGEWRGAAQTGTLWLIIFKSEDHTISGVGKYVINADTTALQVTGQWSPNGKTLSLSFYHNISAAASSLAKFDGNYADVQLTGTLNGFGLLNSPILMARQP